MLTFLKDAREAVNKKNENLLIIGQQNSIIGNLERKIEESRNTLSKNEENIEQCELEYINITRELKNIESKFEERKAGLKLIEIKISELKKQEKELLLKTSKLTDSVNISETIVKDNYALILQLEERIESLKSPKIKKQEAVSKLIRILNLCIELKRLE